MTASQPNPGPESARHPSHRAAPAVESARLAAFAAARRHSARVRLLKLSLPVMAVAIVATFVVYSFGSMPGGVTIDIGETGFADGKLVMANPKLEGFSNNRPYSMTAARALQDPGEAELIELEGIDAKLPVDGDNWAMVEAAAGIFDRVKNTLVIDHPVTVTTTDGKTALLQSASLNAKSGSLTTDKPIDIRMEGMHILADSMQILKNGQVLVFDKRVRMNIDPGKMKTAEAEALNAQN